jgi:hypothetical protein
MIDSVDLERYTYLPVVVESTISSGGVESFGKPMIHVFYRSIQDSQHLAVNSQVISTTGRLILVGGGHACSP